MSVELRGVEEERRGERERGSEENALFSCPYFLCSFYALSHSHPPSLPPSLPPSPPAENQIKAAIAQGQPSQHLRLLIEDHLRIEEKKHRKRAANRRSASSSRARKKKYIERLANENRCGGLWEGGREGGREGTMSAFLLFFLYFLPDMAYPGLSYMLIIPPSLPPSLLSLPPSFLPSCSPCLPQAPSTHLSNPGHPPRSSHGSE